MPVATTVKLVVPPRITDWFVGWRMMAGGTNTVSTAGALVTEPTKFETITE